MVQKQVDPFSGSLIISNSYVVSEKQIKITTTTQDDTIENLLFQRGLRYAIIFFLLFPQFLLSSSTQLITFFPQAMDQVEFDTAGDPLHYIIEKTHSYTKPAKYNEVFFFSRELYKPFIINSTTKQVLRPTHKSVHSSTAEPASGECRLAINRNRHCIQQVHRPLGQISSTARLTNVFITIH